MPKSDLKKSSCETRKRKCKNCSATKMNTYMCRVCKRPHGLKSCRKFLAMNISERLRMVRIHNYCQNCLAHDHSQGTCFSKHGCRHCKKFHHTLLHINSRLRKDLLQSPSRSRSSSSSSSIGSCSKPPMSTSNSIDKSSTTPKDQRVHSLSSLLRQNVIVLLPTILVKIKSHAGYARCLLDSGSTISRVAKKFVEKLRLTTLTMEQETMCPLTLISRLDGKEQIECILSVDNRISIQTPKQSLKSSFKENYRDLILADPKFYEPSGIDIILGVGVYTKIIREGILNKPGLPIAQSTTFGWVIYGPSNLT